MSRAEDKRFRVPTAALAVAITMAVSVAGPWTIMTFFWRSDSPLNARVTVTGVLAIVSILFVGMVGSFVVGFLRNIDRLPPKVADIRENQQQSLAGGVYASLDPRIGGRVRFPRHRIAIVFAAMCYPAFESYMAFSSNLPFAVSAVLAFAWLGAGWLYGFMLGGVFISLMSKALFFVNSIYVPPAAYAEGLWPAKRSSDDSDWSGLDNDTYSGDNGGGD